MHREDGKRDDAVYENIDKNITGQSGKEITDRNAMRIQSSELKGSDGVTISRAAGVCLGLLCVLLLTAVIVLCVLIYTKSTNYTEEKQQLLTKITNLTEERNQLLTNNASLFQLNKQFNQEKYELAKILQDGWIYYQFSLYYVSTETKSWTESRRYCRERGADLVIINDSKTQDFVKKISSGSQTWIGLTDTKWKAHGNGLMAAH
ncbi:C-type lectin domain family 12 member A-like isoform X2 [Carassius carassius]|uniref:C-type lectin domain family 12 member A-like isoform X2 n=1 Tax=Carassius carassius TaxID=217509 RepID=UPI00286979AB|nr:C-type lectin domain family 12 member A-like isoform X2 [Carassius carassius]